MVSKAQKLRELFKREGFFRLVGAHNGLTAKLIENAGFEGIWASSLEVSASHAVPDANILTMTDYLNAAISMNDAVSIPVVVDVDQGYGNSTNVIRMVKKFESSGIAGIIMEEKKFPKQNSLLTGGRTELASISEFVGKIMAAKNAQQSMDFMVMARIEALIAGWGHEEAMKRARAYVKAGADAIMIHSKKSDSAEVEKFINDWGENIPLVIVPTNYYNFIEEHIKKYPKIKMVIYANHVIRSAVKAIKDTLKEIKETGGIKTISENGRLVPVKELFELQGTHEMKESEKKFLQDDKREITAVIPAAGAPNEETLKPLLKDTHICMLDINGKPVLTRTVEMLNSVGINNVNVITGYNAHKIKVDGINKIENSDYNVGVLQSIMCAEQHMDQDTLIVFSDILFEKNVLERLISRTEDIVLVIDSSLPQMQADPRETLELVKAKHTPATGNRVFRLNESNEIIRMNVPLKEATHEFFGMALFSKKGIEEFKKAYFQLKGEGKENQNFAYIIQKLIDSDVAINCLEIHKGWTEVHSFQDYKDTVAVIR